MFKILASDIDHTILPRGGTISDRDIQALHRLHQEGIIVVLASGRATASTRRILQGIFREDPPDYLISYNGARLESLQDGKTLLATNLPPNVIRVIGSWCRRQGCVLQGYTGEDILVEAENPYISAYSTTAGMGYRVVPDIADAVAAAGGSPKLVCHDEVDRLPHHIEALRAVARGRWEVVTSMPIFVEIVSPGTNKGTALGALANHLGCSLSEVIAVGDNLNDMEMIREAGVGVAVANAVPQLKEVADWITTRDEHNSALAEVVDRYF
jgi:Cof subfamily protein (haloacid dehalogenase superfamily)